MTYPFDVPKTPPYTNADMTGYNPTEVHVFCERCKYSIMTNLRMPQCGNCHHFLIVYVKSHFNEV